MAATSDHPRFPRRSGDGSKPRSGKAGGSNTNGSSYRQRQQQQVSRPRLVEHHDEDEVRTNEPTLLPQNEAAERALIGSALIDEEVLETCGFVKPQYFFRQQNGLVWAALQKLRADGSSVDPITLSESLRSENLLDDAGGVDSVLAYGNGVPHSGHARDYARIVCEKYVSRYSLTANAQLAQAGYRGDLQEIAAAWALSHAEMQEVFTALGVNGEVRRFQFMTDEEVEALPDPAWLIHDILVENTVSVAFGDYGSGKSFLALDWALSIATGFPWMGQLVKRGLVAYIAGEGIGGMKRRIRAWKKHHRWTNGATGVHLLGTAPQLLQPEDVQSLLASLRGLPDAPVLVVIDTLSRSMSGGEENLQRDMSIAVAAAEIIRAEFGCHVLIVHHKPSGASKTRGSTVLPGAAQTLIDVSKDGNIMTISCPKQKDHKAFLPLRYRLHPVELDERDHENNSLVLVPLTTAEYGEDDSGPVKLTKAAENVIEILKKSPGHAAQFMVIVNAMAAQPYRMAKSTTANALNLARDARLVENTGTLWQLLE